MTTSSMTAFLRDSSTNTSDALFTFLAIQFLVEIDLDNGITPNSFDMHSKELNYGHYWSYTVTPILCSLDYPLHLVAIHFFIVSFSFNC